MSAGAPSLQHRLEHAAFRGLAGGLMALGTPRDLRAAEALGRGFCRTVGLRRAVVRANLRRAFPAAPDGWIRETAAAAYAHFTREMLVAMRFPDLSRDEVLATGRGEDLEALRAAVAGGRGVVVATGHFGNWEAGIQAIAARGIPCAAVAQRQKNPLFDAAMNRGRERFGTVVIDRRHATRGALRALARGRAVFFVADQNAGSHGVFVPFFGHLASTHRGPALLAARAGVPVFAMVHRRVGDWSYRIETRRVADAVPTDPDEGVRAVTAEFTAFLEEQIRRAPEQYFWFHRRWKSRPPEEPNGAAAGIQMPMEMERDP